MPTCQRETCTNIAMNAKHGYCLKHAQGTGLMDHHVPAEPTKNRIHQLLNNGWTIRAIAASAGLTTVTIGNITSGRTTSVRTSTARKINQLTNHTNKGPWLPAWPTQRRLRSLQAAGWTQTAIANATNTSQAGISTLTTGKRHVTRATAENIAALYAKHEGDPVREPSPAARKHGWVPPAWWDNIDNPEEQPGVTHCLSCHAPTIRSSGQCNACYNRRYSRAYYQRTKNNAA